MEADDGSRGGGRVVVVARCERSFCRDRYGRSLKVPGNVTT